ncbi:uncharacterized protein DS421_2g33240 [Arachis hypogaea]|nr:uncharacterized protein DS421_2g33240 [Arachis hypogaea]
MVAAYNIRHGAWLRAYYEGDGTLCTSIRNLDGSHIVNAFGSPQYSTNSLGCPVYFAFTSSQASLVSQVDLGSQRRSLSPPVAGVQWVSKHSKFLIMFLAADAGSFFEWIRC